MSFASARNPVDVTGQIASDQEVMPLAYRLMLEDGDYDSLVVFQSAAGLSPRVARSWCSRRWTCARSIRIG